MAKEYEEIVNDFMRRIAGLRSGISNMYLFGSRARGTARPDSDYDILIVVPKKDKEFKSKLYDAVIDVELEKGGDISLKIIDKKHFDYLKNIASPFMENVIKEGIKIG